MSNVMKRVPRKRRIPLHVSRRRGLVVNDTRSVERRVGDMGLERMK